LDFTSPANTTNPVVHNVSQATLDCGSNAKKLSINASDTWSETLSGCPSETDSEVNKYDIGLVDFNCCERKYHFPRYLAIIKAFLVFYGRKKYLKMKNKLVEKHIGQKTIWTGGYLGNSIEVHNSWFNGKVLINGSKQKVNYGWFGKSTMECDILNQNSKAKFKMKLVAGFFKVKCSLFADGTEIKMVEV
jgi:hypothetical protein